MKDDLLGDILDEMGAETFRPLDEPDQVKRAALDDVYNLPIGDVDPSPFQPRKIFNQKTLDDLAQSIKENGLLSPVTVRRVGERYELVAGERRLRAMKSIGHEFIPGIVREYTDEQSHAFALIENIQRDDINCIEAALSLRDLKDNYSLTQEKLSAVYGKDRTRVSKVMALLDLPKEVVDLLMQGDLSQSHGELLCNPKLEVEKVSHFATVSVKNNWGKRHLDEAIRKYINASENPPLPSVKPEVPGWFSDLSQLIKSRNESAGRAVKTKFDNKNGVGEVKLSFDINEVDEFEAAAKEVVDALRKVKEEMLKNQEIPDS